MPPETLLKLTFQVLISALQYVPLLFLLWFPSLHGPLPQHAPWPSNLTRNSPFKFWSQHYNMFFLLWFPSLHGPPPQHALLPSNLTRNSPFKFWSQHYNMFLCSSCSDFPPYTDHLHNMLSCPVTSPETHLSSSDLSTTICSSALLALISLLTRTTSTTCSLAQ